MKLPKCYALLCLASSAVVATEEDVEESLSCIEQPKRFVTKNGELVDLSSFSSSVQVSRFPRLERSCCVDDFILATIFNFCVPET